MKEESIYRVQALDRALDILECFSFQHKVLGLSDVVEKTGLNKTTVKRLISNLTERGYLQQIPNTKQYQLGMKLFELGGVIFSSFSLRKTAAHHMTRLSNETGATILLAVNMDDELVYVEKRDGSGMIRISSDVGWRRPLHYGMLGMVLMAHMDPDHVDRILEKTPLEAHTPYSILDRDAFLRRLEEIRESGYVLEREEAVEGVQGIASPVRDYSRQVVAALGAGFPVIKSHSAEDIEEMVRLVRATADEISSDLGYLKI